MKSFMPFAKAVMLIAALAMMGTSPTLLAQATFLSQLSNRTVWAGATVKFAASTSGFGSTKYRWLFDSTNLPCGLFITTFAGNGANGFFGDEGAATNAELNNPGSVICDASGNLLIADTGNNRVRKVDTNGIITTLAGGGINFADNVAATNSSLFPSGIALDASGNLFVADSGNNRIRKVDTNGIITTVAGNGTPGHSGDGGAATNASLSPSGITVDTAGNLYFSENGSEIPPSFIRKVDTNGIITTVAGNGTNNLNPFQVGDGGPATNAYLWQPRQIILDNFGNLLIADTRDERIRKVDTNGIITTIAGTGTNSFSGDGKAATNASLSSPAGIALDNAGNLFIADVGNNRIRKVSTNGIISTVAGNSGGFMDNVLATNNCLNQPHGVAVDAFGDLFIADTFNQSIRMVSSPQLPNSLSAVLTLSNVTVAESGNYQEVITDDYGSATSNIGKLLVVTSPLIYQSTINPDRSLTLNFVSPPQSTNIVQATTNLTPPIIWIPISTNSAGADGDWNFTDINTAASTTQFYRSLTQ
jgi:sugar lactone lactonase YvrE